MKAVTGLAKGLVCGVAALVVTVASSWAFVESTSVAHWVDMPTVVIVAKADRNAVRLVQADSTGLLQ